MAISLSGCFGDDLKSYDELTVIAGSDKFQVSAFEWLETNLPNGKFSDVAGKHHYGGGMAPGSYWVENNFSWFEYGLAKHSKIYLVVNSANSIEAVLFQERSRVGIFVEPKNPLTQKSSLPAHFREVASRVGVFNMVE